MGITCHNGMDHYRIYFSKNSMVNDASVSKSSHRRPRPWQRCVSVQRINIIYILNFVGYFHPSLNEDASHPLPKSGYSKGFHFRFRYNIYPADDDRIIVTSSLQSCRYINIYIHNSGTLLYYNRVPVIFLSRPMPLTIVCILYII